MAIEREINGTRVDSWSMHREMRDIYTWSDIASRTETVYNLVSNDLQSSDLLDRCKR